MSLKNLNKYVKAYEKGQPLIPDSIYDALVGNDGPLGRAGDIELPYRMYSLKKYYDINEAPKLTGIVKSPKLDGVAVSVTYLDGKPIAAYSRGDGIKGKDISSNLAAIIVRNKNVSIPFDGERIVHGEVVASEFVENARNIVAGVLNSLEPDIEKIEKYDIQFLAYNIFPNPSDSWMDCMEPLESVLNATDTMPTDGWVYRCNSYREYERLGFTSKYPRGAFALKEQTEQVKTVLNEVTWQLGKNGTLTPVAILEPIKIGGATISRATLHNPGFIEDIELSVGDNVLVERRGGIIPQVVKKVS